MLPSMSHIPLNLDEMFTHQSFVKDTEAPACRLFKGSPQDRRCTSVSHSEPANPDAHQTHRQVQKCSTFDLSTECPAMIILSSVPLIHLLPNRGIHLLPVFCFFLPCVFTWLWWRADRQDMLLLKASVCCDEGKERADIHACCALLGQSGVSKEGLNIHLCCRRRLFSVKYGRMIFVCKH